MASLLLPVPHLQQRASGECLAACAAMVLAYLKMPLDYNRLLKLLHIKTEIGAPASNIRNLEALGVKILYKQGHGFLIKTQHRLNSGKTGKNV